MMEHLSACEVERVLTSDSDLRQYFNQYLALPVSQHVAVQLLQLKLFSRFSQFTSTLMMIQLLKCLCVISPLIHMLRIPNLMSTMN